MPFDVKMSHQTIQQGHRGFPPRDGPPENYQVTQPYRMEIRASLTAQADAAQVGWLAGCTARTAESAKATRLPLTLQLPLAGAARGNKGEKRMGILEPESPSLRPSPGSKFSKALSKFSIAG